MSTTPAREQSFVVQMIPIMIHFTHLLDHVPLQDNSIDLATKALKNHGPIRSSQAKSIIRGLLKKIERVEMSVHAAEKDGEALKEQLRAAETPSTDWQRQFQREFTLESKKAFFPMLQVGLMNSELRK